MEVSIHRKRGKAGSRKPKRTGLAWRGTGGAAKRKIIFIRSFITQQTHSAEYAKHTHTPICPDGPISHPRPFRLSRALVTLFSFSFIPRTYLPYPAHSPRPAAALRHTLCLSAAPLPARTWPFLLIFNQRLFSFWSLCISRFDSDSFVGSPLRKTESETSIGRPTHRPKWWL